MRTLISVVLHMASLISLQCKGEKVYKSRDMEPVYPAEWDLPAMNSYDRIFEVTEDNHDAKILESNDAWIVIFYKEKVKKKWRQLASEIGGAVWFGTVDVRENPKLLKRLKLNLPEDELSGGVAVVYPADEEKKEIAIRNGNLKYTINPKKAELFASATIPDRGQALDFSPESMQNFNDWIVKGYYGSKPPKFPVICITDQAETPIHIKVVAEYFHTHFSFGIIRKESVPAMRRQFMHVPEPTKYPMFLMLLGREPSTKEMSRGVYNMHFNIMPYLEQKYGEPGHIRSLINFLFTANDDYREELPGRSVEEKSSISEMKAIREKLTDRVKLASKNPKTKKNRSSVKSEL